MPTIGVDGDGGDVVASMLIAREMGGAEFLLHQGRNPRPFNGIANMLLPLLNSQSYISNAIWTQPNPPGVTHNLCHWRAQYYKPTQTLAQSMANSIGMGPLSYHPWIHVQPSPKTHGRILLARTRRYNNLKFPWRQVLTKFRTRIMFMGLQEERQQLERLVGWRLEPLVVRNFLEAAQYIAGSDLMVTNQTIYYWLAAAQGHPLVQETEVIRKIHDSMVPLQNSVFSMAGEFPFDNLPQKMNAPYPLMYEI